MKIAQIVPRMESGGVERGTVEVAEALLARNHVPFVISEGGAMVHDLDRLGVRHIRMAVARKSPSSLRGIGQIARFLSDEHVDVVHCRSRLPAWLTLLALRKFTSSKPRFVTSVHGLHSISRYSSVVGKGERIEAVSNTAREYLLHNYPGVDESRIRVIFRGIDPSQYHRGFRPSYEWQNRWDSEMGKFNPDSNPVLTIVGRITRLKGQHEFLSVLEHLNSSGFPCKGLIVGSEISGHSRYAASLRKRVTRSAHLRNSVWFTGRRSDVREIICKSSFVLSLSTKPESFGRTVLEALSLGTQVVAFDHGGVGEIVKRLFPPGAVTFGEIQSVAARIADLCKEPKSIESHDMTLERMCEETVAMYQELVQ
ncbi:MAG: glycosyltransferase [Gammaproteobacteria bacterium]|nr:glycosyltransferase [Gammaproteobacteria bacterium]